MADYSDFSVGTTVYKCKCGNIVRSKGEECSNCSNESWEPHKVTHEDHGYDENGNRKN